MTRLALAATHIHQRRWDEWRSTIWALRAPGTRPEVYLSVLEPSDSDREAAIAFAPGDGHQYMFPLSRRDLALLQRRIGQFLERTK